jgi:hypothetical protein
MSKVKNFTKKPITWGGLFKAYGIMVLLCLPYYAWLIYKYRKYMKELNSYIS